MDVNFWNLFWTTGLPEAWLMSRDAGAPPLSGESQGAGQGLTSPQITPSAAPVSNVPGNPKNIY